MEINTTFDANAASLQINSGTATERSTGSSTTANASSDTADWSKEALSLASSDSSGLVSPVLTLNAQNAILQQHLTSALATKLEQAGISVDQTITLTRDAEGTVQVVGDCADKDAIEQIFADESSLTEAFNTLADNSELARSYSRTQTSSLVRANGYAAYLEQWSGSSSDSDTSSGSFYLSLLDGDSTTYFS